MRIRRILAAFPAMAVGMALWKHALWEASPEGFEGDGTVQGLEALFYHLLSLLFLILSGLIFFKPHFLRDLVRCLEGIGTAAYEPGESRREEDTSELFY
jgi:hypothetical protein